MTARRFAACLLLAAVMLLTGCAVLEPDHITFSAGRDEAETTAGDRRVRTITTRGNVSITFDLGKR